jgi:hypothetical protein
MGTTTVPLPVSYVEMMFNGWEIMGQFMYPRESYQRLLDLIRSGQLDMNIDSSDRLSPGSASPSDGESDEGGEL